MPPRSINKTAPSRMREITHLWGRAIKTIETTVTRVATIQPPGDSNTADAVVTTVVETGILVKTVPSLNFPSTPSNLEPTNTAAEFKTVIETIFPFSNNPTEGTIVTSIELVSPQTTFPSLSLPSSNPISSIPEPTSTSTTLIPSSTGPSLASAPSTTSNSQHTPGNGFSQSRQLNAIIGSIFGVLSLVGLLLICYLYWRRRYMKREPTFHPVALPALDTKADTYQAQVWERPQMIIQHSDSGNSLPPPSPVVDVIDLPPRYTSIVHRSENVQSDR